MCVPRRHCDHHVTCSQRGLSFASMKRRGGGGGGGGGSADARPVPFVRESDMDDRELSDAAKARIAEKAKKEAQGASSSAAAAQPLPVGFIVAAVAVAGVMLYLTLKFSV